MKIALRFKPSSSRLFIASIVVFVFPALFSSPLWAWKPIAHLHLSLVARADAIDDGLVTIYEVDYASGRILTNPDGSLKEIGRYPVDGTFLAAIRDFPRQFKAGAIGPRTLSPTFSPARWEFIPTILRIITASRMIGWNMFWRPDAQGRAGFF